MGAVVLDDAGFGLAGTSGVPHPGAVRSPPFCDPDLYLLGFIGINYCCGWCRVGGRPALAPGPGGGILRVRDGFGDLEGQDWEAGGHMVD